MTARLKALVEDNLAAVSAKDTTAALSGFAYDGVLIDPHYPKPRMAGHTEIRNGLQWVFSTMRELNFTPLNWHFAENGERVAVEVSSRHVLATGRELTFEQCFVIDSKDGVIQRWRAYTPYAPNGIGGVVLSVERMRHRRLSNRRPR